MFEMNDRVPLFEQFINYPIEFLVTEAGIIIPENEWVRQQVLVPGRVNYGEDESEYLDKFIDRAWTPGNVDRLTLPDSGKIVQIDRTRHAGHQAFRWIHRNDQVTWQEIMRDLTAVLPLIRQALADGKLKLGSNDNAVGQVWIENIKDDLNTIVQVKPADKEGQDFKMVVVTILRKEDATFKDRSLMKILTNGTKTKIERYGVGEARPIAPKR